MRLLDGFRWFSPAWIAGFLTFYGGGKDGGDAPDYGPMAEASEKAAQLGKELGEEQLAENKRQYDQNFAVAQPIVKAQTDLAYQQLDQGNDYYNYMKQYSRPTETALFYESMGLNPDEIAQIESYRAGEIATQKAAADQAAATRAATPEYTTIPGTKLETYYADGAKSGTGKVAIVGYKDGPSVAGHAVRTPIREVLDKNKQYIKNKDGSYTEAQPQYRTVDDTKTIQINANERVPINQSYNTPETNAMVAKMAAQAGIRQQDEAASSAIADSRKGYADAVNTAIRQGLRYGAAPSKIAATVGTQGTQMASAQAAAASGARDKAKNLSYAKKLDVAGLYKGLPGVSQAAYGLTVGAGNSAVDNTMKPSVAYMNGINQGNNTIQTGMGQQISGLGNILAAQTSAYNNSQSDGGMWGALGSLGGAALSSKFWV